MYVFMQQKTDGSPNNIQKNMEKKGEKEKGIGREKKTHAGGRNGFPKPTSFKPHFDGKRVNFSVHTRGVDIRYILSMRPGLYMNYMGMSHQTMGCAHG